MDSANQELHPYALVVMGVSGCGKSSVAQLLGDTLGWAVCEGDAYHPPANISKMQAGVALTDADRQGWLQDLAALLHQAQPAQGMVLTCSALKRSYRDVLRQALPKQALGFVFLDLTFDMALERVRTRQGHFFSADLVANQFLTLERPDTESDVVAVDAGLALPAIVQHITAWRSNAAADAVLHRKQAS